MQSTIGQHFDHTPAKRYIALGMGIAFVFTDILVYVMRYSESVRLSLSLVAFAIFVYLTDGDLASLGLRSRPKQGWSRWTWISAKIFCIVAGCVVVGLGVWHLLGYELKVYSISPDHAMHNLLHMCVVAPVLEETMYRLVVFLSLVSTIGCWNTILVSGVLFAVLHVVYGNPSPENLVGGFFFAWIYLKSETILLPIILHALGNFIAFCCQLAAWYYLHVGG